MEEEINVINKSCEVVKIKELLDEYKKHYGINSLYKLLDDLDGFYGLVTTYERNLGEPIKTNNEDDKSFSTAETSKISPRFQTGEASIYSSDPSTIEKVNQDFLNHAADETSASIEKPIVKTLTQSPKGNMWDVTSVTAPGQINFNDETRVL